MRKPSVVRCQGKRGGKGEAPFRKTPAAKRQVTRKMDSPETFGATQGLFSLLATLCPGKGHRECAWLRSPSYRLSAS